MKLCHQNTPVNQKLQLHRQLIEPVEKAASTKFPPDCLSSESSPIKTLLAGVAPKHDRPSKQSLAGLLPWKIGRAVSM